MNSSRIFRGNSQHVPRGIVADDLVKGAMPDDDRLIPEPLIEILTPNFPVPQGVIAPGNKRNRLIGVYRGECREFFFIGLWGFGTKELPGGQGPVVRGKKRKLGEYGGK